VRCEGGAGGARPAGAPPRFGGPVAPRVLRSFGIPTPANKPPSAGFAGARDADEAAPDDGAEPDLASPTTRPIAVKGRKGRGTEQSQKVVNNQV
jgi:hypothetical protein